jgi:hypothetical protein
MASCKRIALMALLYVDEEVLFDAASAMTNTEANASAAAAWLSVIPRFSIPSTQGVKKRFKDASIGQFPGLTNAWKAPYNLRAEIMRR